MFSTSYYSMIYNSREGLKLLVFLFIFLLFFSYLRFVMSFIEAGIALSLLLLRTRVLRFFILQMVSGKEFISFLWSHNVWRFSIL